MGTTYEREPRKVLPIPEAIGPDWTVEEGPGLCDTKGKRILIPTGSSDLERHIRAHEMAHAAKSPADWRRPKNMHPEAMQRAEDMRMNWFCRRWGLNSAMDAPITTPDFIAGRVGAPLASGDRIMPATAAMSTYRTGDWEPVIDAIRAADPTLAAQLEKFCADEWSRFDAAEDEPTWADALGQARRAMKLFGSEQDESGNEGEDGEGEGGEQGEGSPGDPSDGEGEGEGETVPESGPVPLNEAPPIPDDDDEGGYGGGGRVKRDEQDAPTVDRETVDARLEETRQKYRGMVASQSDTRVGWGEMIIWRPPQPRRIPASLQGRRKVPGDMGAVMRHPHRLTTDRAIFAVDGRRPGGASVLIDCSGSMSFTVGDIEKIVHMLPASIIGCYSGDIDRESGPMRGKRWLGELWIIAENGQYAEKSNLRPHRGRLVGESRGDTYGGNAVDGPALEWLARQPGPRYWVSDGVVVGAEGANYLVTQGCWDECQRICRQAGILQLRTMTELRHFLDTGRIR